MRHNFQPAQVSLHGEGCKRTNALTHMKQTYFGVVLKANEARVAEPFGLSTSNDRCLIRNAELYLFVLRSCMKPRPWHLCSDMKTEHRLSFLQGYLTFTCVYIMSECRQCTYVICHAILCYTLNYVAMQCSVL